MAQPPSATNSNGLFVDTIYDGTGTSLVKLAIGSKNVGFDVNAGWTGVATHAESDDFVASDGIVVVGGREPISELAVVAQYDADGRAIVQADPTTTTLTDRSGTITTADTDQVLAAANLTRKYLLVQNLDDGEPLWINFGVAAVATQPSYRIDPGQTFKMEGNVVSSQAVHVISGVTGHLFTAKEA